MKNARKVMMVITCMALMGAMQALAVTYKPLKPQRSYYGQPMPVVNATAPAATFHSTSAMKMSDGVYTSTINTNGTVNEAAYGVGMSGPRRVGGAASPGEEDDEPGSGSGLNQESQDDDRENGTPIGEAVPPMMLLACAYLIIRATRKRREIEE